MTAYVLAGIAGLILGTAIGLVLGSIMRSSAMADEAANAKRGKP